MEHGSTRHRLEISDSFTGSLAKLTSKEQKAVKTTAFDWQMNPENPGHRFHKMDRVQDKNFWTVSVNRDIRIIAHRLKSSWLLCYVGHHDAALKWAERRKIETHPETGASQIMLVEIPERVEETTGEEVDILVEAVRKSATKKGPVEKSANLSDDEITQSAPETGASASSEVTRALMVEVVGDLYAVPLNSIEGIVNITPAELETYYEYPDSRLEYAGQEYEVCYLGSLLSADINPRVDGTRKTVYLVLLHSEKRNYAVQVDELLNNSEIVVKSIGPQLSVVPGLSGATVLDDGQVVVILDIMGLLHPRRSRLRKAV